MRVYICVVVIIIVKIYYFLVKSDKFYESFFINLVFYFISEIPRMPINIGVYLIGMFPLPQSRSHLAVNI